MQVVFNLASDAVVSTQSDPEVGGMTTTNGQYLIVVPPGAAVTVDETSTPASVAADSAAELLIRYPMYDHVLYNYFLDSTDVGDLDLSSSAPQPNGGSVVSGTPPTLDPGPVPRCQVGRAIGPNPGVAPNSVAMLPSNPTALIPTYGCIILATVDLTPFNPGTPGTDNLMLWWDIATVVTSEDVAHGYNTTLGVNTPAIRSSVKADQEPADYYVYVSVDDGVSWAQADYLEPTDLAAAGTDLRVAFVWEGAQKLYLNGFAVMLQDLP